MSITRIIGDIHGKFYDYETYCLKQVFRHKSDNVPTHSVQVGDFGVGFARDYWHEEVNSWMKDNPTHKFIRGNHDSPQKCKEMHGWIADGVINGNVMYIGGAWSIDHAYRTEGVDWWADEELSIEELNKIYDRYVLYKPKFLITHDCPTTVAYEMFIANGNSLTGTYQIKTRTGEALQAMFEAHQPDFHFFGHWHNTRQSTINGTRFVCLGELDYVDVDFESVENTHKLLNEKFDN